MSLPSPAAPTGDRFATVSETDYGAPLFIATILTLAFTFLVLIVRITVVKWRTWSLDDLVLVCATIVGLGQWISIFIAYDNGLGKDTSMVDSGDLPRMAKFFFASRTLLVIALCLSKCSLVLTIRALFTRDLKTQWQVSNIAIGTICAWGAASALTISVDCSPNYVVLGQQNVKCANHVIRLRAIFISDVMLECAIVILPALFLISVSMAWNRKLLVTVAFAFRLPTVACIIAYLIASTRFLSSNRTGVNITATVIWQQVLLGYSLMSVTIPTLKSFVRGFTTGGMGFSKNINTNIGSSQHSQRNIATIQLNMLSKNSSARSALTRTAPDPMPVLMRSRSVSHLSESLAQDYSSVTSQGSRQVMIR
ncbi:hypothetical protein K469DRAFT_620199 [Zopfia rhizophila CBS 207.26]|uniref:Rhodopsin domain-containing protein n=1 Tax=Zopfia rhizophila CBS 207.26 TaxID=1314779 RepID=A0A6A6EN90_9PEZI|nr:hypothetical protein K469DRAFT_620199 [Zopfia rhizophila CBS 207.26]